MTNLDSVTRAALVDASKRTGLARGELSVHHAEAVTWPDSSLGCPEPGMMYAQALVPGYRVRIRAGEQLLDYHGGVHGGLVPCPPERSHEPLPSGSI